MAFSLPECGQIIAYNYIVISPWFFGFILFETFILSAKWRAVLTEDSCPPLTNQESAELRRTPVEIRQFPPNRSPPRTIRRTESESGPPQPADSANVRHGQLCVCQFLRPAADFDLVGTGGSPPVSGGLLICPRLTTVRRGNCQMES